MDPQGHAGYPEEVRRARLTKIRRPRGLTTDRHVRRQIADGLFLVNDDRTEARVNDIRSLVVTCLELISRSTMSPLRAGNRPNQRNVVHLLGEFREDLADLHSVR